MKLFILSQKKYHDFTEPDAVNDILVRAENEFTARAIANANEHENRDDAQNWGVEDADCKELNVDGEEGVVLVS